ncbi:hypothetical protein RISW2_19540 [Roseivivax isoporae LMG 25204]|uniref:YjiS-like domain-containing protein n=2 Tax=Roseivivax TaxID=93682 RepID=X7FCR5_9RHOB|nr:DUF1127 domain-containing protein [Roseivivax isoporae]ETX29854.1 hypothetical protein RISW2_19540 [Roseivivax isoporae LMG 25204]
MNIYTPPRTNHAAAAVAGRVGAVIASAYAALVDWRDARRTERLLSSLSDRELDDIGLTRSDILRVSRR